MKKYIFLIVLLIISANIFSLTLEEAINIGLKNSSILKSAEETLNQAKWDYYQANTEHLPSAQLIGAYVDYLPNNVQQNIEIEGAITYGLRVNLPLFVGGKLWQNSRIKKESYQIAQDSYKNARLNLIADIENKFFVVLESQKNHEIAEKEYTNAVNLESITEARFQKGSIIEAELLRMKSLTGQKKVRMMQTHTNYLTSMLDLKATLSIDEDIDLDENYITTNEDTDSLESRLNIEYWNITEIESFLKAMSKEAENRNLTLKITEKNINISKRVLTVATGNFLPTINLSHDKDFSKPIIKNMPNQDLSESGNLMLSVSIPIFPITNNVTEYLKNKSSLRSSEYGMITTKNNISLEIRNATLNWISSIQMYSSAKMSLDYAQRSWEAMNQRYNNGVITNNDMLDADITLSNANLQFNSSYFNIQRSRSTLKQLLNIESNEDFEELISRMMQ
jgi:outer membrane protein TolC